MQRAIAATRTGCVTTAVRDSEIDGQHIYKGQMLGLCNDKIVLTGEDMIDTAVTLAQQLYHPKAALITVFYGEEISAAQAAALGDRLETAFGSRAEISVLDGGQPIYPFLIAVES